MSTVLYILLALLLLGIMITVHELGHFLAARACGIAVRAFGIGFGPRLFYKVSKKSGTEYSLRLIPCGGFCAFYGEDDTTGKVSESDPRSLLLQPAWKRFLTIAMGPIMNFVLAFVVAFCFFLGYGLPYAGDHITTTVVSTRSSSPAREAGIAVNDIITHVDDVAVNGNFSDLINDWSGEAPIKLTVLRADEELILSLTPEFDDEENRYLIGAMLQQSQEIVWLRTPLLPTLTHTYDVCLQGGKAVLNALSALLTRGEGLDQMAGPVGVISLIADETRAYQLMGYLNMLIMISINLGLLNLLPIPGLDGCRLLFVLFEMIFRRPVNRRVESYIHLSGYILLLGLMLYFTFHDVLNLFG